MAGYWLSSFFYGCMDRDEAVSAEEKSRFGYRAKAAPIRNFQSLTRKFILSCPSSSIMRMLLAVSPPINSLYVAP